MKGPVVSDAACDADNDVITVANLEHFRLKTAEQDVIRPLELCRQSIFLAGQTDQDAVAWQIDAKRLDVAAVRLQGYV